MSILSDSNNPGEILIVTIPENDPEPAETSTITFNLNGEDSNTDDSVAVDDLFRLN